MVSRPQAQRSPIKLGGLKKNELINNLQDGSIKTPKFLGRVKADLTKYLTKIRPFNRPAVREEKNKEVLI